MNEIKLIQKIKHNYSDGDVYTSYWVEVDGRRYNSIQLYKFKKQGLYHAYRLTNGNPSGHEISTPILKNVKKFILDELI